MLLQNNETLLASLQAASQAGNGNVPQSGPDQVHMLTDDDDEYAQDYDYDEWEEPHSSAEAWRTVIPGKKRQASKSTSSTLITRLQFAPPLNLITEVQEAATFYEDIVKTPQPRRTTLDRALYNPQRKMELAMNHLITITEKSSDPNLQHDLDLLGAIVRSAYEDLNDNRRRLLAGRSGHVLERRSDLESSRLLTESEEQKLRAASAGKGGRGKSFPHFKGKGKGRFPQTQQYRSGRPESPGVARGHPSGKPSRPFRGRSATPSQK